MKVQFYSQFGEDKFLVDNCSLPAKGVMIDVGAGDPFKLSNSAFFEQQGWEVVCIEADLRRIEKLRKYRKNVMPAIVSDLETVDFVEHRQPDLSHIKIGTARKCMRLDKIVEYLKFDKIDIISIDVEGHEMNVLRSMGKVRPNYLIVEFITPNKPNREKEITEFVKGIGYHYMVTLGVNLIFSKYENNVNEFNRALSR